MGGARGGLKCCQKIPAKDFIDGGLEKIVGWGWGRPPPPPPPFGEPCPIWTCVLCGNGSKENQNLSR